MGHALINPSGTDTPSPCRIEFQAGDSVLTDSGKTSSHILKVHKTKDSLLIHDSAKTVARDTVSHTTQKIILNTQAFSKASADSLNKIIEAKKLPYNQLANNVTTGNFLTSIHPYSWAKGTPVMYNDIPSGNPVTGPASPSQRSAANPDWLLLIILGALGLICAIKHSFARYFGQVVDSMYNFQAASAHYKGRNVLFQWVISLLSVNFFIVTSLLLYFCIRIWNITPLSLMEPWQMLGVSALLVLVVLLFRALINGLTGFFFDMTQVIREYRYLINLFYNTLGIVLLPVVILIAYFNYNLSEKFIIAGIILIISAYLIRISRGLIIAKRHEVPKFYMILYLCALEFLPLILGYKLIRIYAG